MSEEAKRIFQSVIKGSNFMTPYLVRYGISGHYVYEVSQGKDFDGRDMFGITVIERAEPHKRRSDLNKLCKSIIEADNYTLELRCL